MEIIPSSQRLALLGYMQMIKYGLPEWLIVEIRIKDPAQETMSSASVADLLNKTFGGYQGRVLICNASEVLMLIEWGKDNSPRKLAKEIGVQLPHDIFETTIVPPTQKGIKKIELILNASSGYSDLYKERMKHTVPTFLIADDDMYMRMLVKTGLQSLGAVIEIADGASVAESYTIYNPDVVFLDIHMPGRSGQEVLEELRQIDPQAYVIMLSADSSVENVQWTKQHGARGFLAKPFNKSKLLSYVSNCPTVKTQES